MLWVHLFQTPTPTPYVPQFGDIAALASNAPGIESAISLFVLFYLAGLFWRRFRH